ncbi:hypothetical protein IPJ91_00790 [bacterium]|nr:MAG: hypothetical protein IPJ91_00790 [bacterium]
MSEVEALVNLGRTIGSDGLNTFAKRLIIEMSRNPLYKVYMYEKAYPKQMGKIFPGPAELLEVKS